MRTEYHEVLLKKTLQLFLSTICGTFYVGAWFKQTRTCTADKTRRTRSSAQSHGDALLKSHPAPVHPDRCRRYNPQFVRATPRRSVRLSVCLSRKLGLEISFRLRCTSHLLHALLPLRRHTGTKNRRAPFLSSDHPTLSPSVSPVFSCRFLPCRVIVSRKDRCGADRATGNKTAPSTLLEKLHRSHESPRCTSPFREGCPALEGESTPSVPSVSRSSTICEVTLRACPQPRGISLRSWFQGWISVPLERTRTKEDRSRVLQAIEGHFAPPKPLRFATALRLLRAGICGVKFWVYKELALNFKPVADVKHLLKISIE